jgi:hypothetical protein
LPSWRWTAKTCWWPLCNKITSIKPKLICWYCNILWKECCFFIFISWKCFKTELLLSKFPYQFNFIIQDFICSSEHLGEDRFFGSYAAMSVHAPRHAVPCWKLSSVYSQVGKLHFRVTSFVLLLYTVISVWRQISKFSDVKRRKNAEGEYVRRRHDLLHEII